MRGAGRLPVVLAMLAAGPLLLMAQSSRPVVPEWAMGSRVLMTGSSHGSEPDGYSVYTAFPIELSVRRALGGHLSLELAARSESREVDVAATPTAVPLGSIEFLPVNLLLQYRFADEGRSGWHPYVGAGVNVTPAWEKSGTLDSMDVSTSVGPALQIGIDRTLTNYLTWNVDFRWNTMRTNIDATSGHIAKLLIDPASLGIGLVVRF